jgi:GDPmannose 4,6-dehydratase
MACAVASWAPVEVPLYVNLRTHSVILFLHYGNPSDSGQLTNLIHNIKLEKMYHFGAPSHVRVGFDKPEYTVDIKAMGTVRILETGRRSYISTRYYQASSFEYDKS